MARGTTGRREGEMERIDGSYIKGLLQKNGFSAMEVSETIGRNPNYIACCMSRGTMGRPELRHIVDLCDGDYDSALGRFTIRNPYTGVHELVNPGMNVVVKDYYEEDDDMSAEEAAALAKEKGLDRIPDEWLQENEEEVEEVVVVDKVVDNVDNTNKPSGNKSADFVVEFKKYLADKFIKGEYTVSVMELMEEVAKCENAG